MTDLERRVECCKCDVEAAKLELQQAELELRNGERHMMEAREKYGKIKIACEQAKNKLRREQSYLAQAESEHQKGFADAS